jgi:hypothetical protein
MQVTILLTNGDSLLLNTDLTMFQVGQKFVVEEGPMYKIVEIKHQIRKAAFGYKHIMSYLLCIEEKP